MHDSKRELLIIAGPCSAETREQTMQTARELVNLCRPDVFRAGIWKSRTNKNTFEGAGAVALQWLTEVRNTFNLPVATEVLSPEHVEMCMHSGIDYVWLGARTVVNPYTVSEICTALKGTKMKVLVKNPVNPDLKLWIGSLERVMSTGITNVFAVHRGFSTYYNLPYRNMPLWEIPNELKRIMPEVKIICDPSHICGRQSCLKDIMQQALDLEMDGLMVESHIRPESAKSDSEQQVTPSELAEILSDLVIRNHEESKDKFLMHLRNEIDTIDDQLIETLARRMKIVEQIGIFKKEQNITILQAQRSRHIFFDRMEKGNRLKLNPAFLKEILKSIHNEAVRIQVEIMNNSQGE